MNWYAYLTSHNILVSRDYIYILTDIVRYNYRSLHTLIDLSRYSQDCFDVAVVGAGIVGLATARELSMRQPHLKFAVIDKEPTVGEI